MILDHVQLAMPQGGEAKARSYFVDILDMKEEVKPPELATRGGCWFRRGSCVVHLGIEPDFSPQRKGHPAFAVADLMDVADRLERGGYDVRWDSAVPGTRRFYTLDPFGNRIEFIADGDGFSQRGGGF